MEGVTRQVSDGSQPASKPSCAQRGGRGDAGSPVTPGPLPPVVRVTQRSGKSGEGRR